MEGNTRRKAFIVMSAALAILAGLFCTANSAQAAGTCAENLIISQIYGGGGNSGATYKNDFVELHNLSDFDVTIDGWTLQYASSSGSFSAANLTPLSGIVKAKSYFLIAQARGSGGTEELPDPDATGTVNLSATAGKVALSQDTTPVSSGTDPFLIDIVNYSGAGNTKSIYRNMEVCPNTFFAEIASPRNSAFSEPVESNSQNEDGNTDLSAGCLKISTDVRLNELLPHPSNGNEFVEILNSGSNCVDVSGWKIMDEANHKKTFPENSIMRPGEYLLLEGNLYLNNDSDTAYLLNINGSLKSDAIDSRSYEETEKGSSFGLYNGDWFWTSTPTPGRENIITAPESGNIVPGEFFSFSENIFLNEILPNPKGEEKTNEYIEIKNDGNEEIDLYGWMIRDASKKGKFVFKEHVVIKAGTYHAIYRPQFKIALNNGAESIYLFNPAGALVSSASYDKAPQGASYNFDGKTWKWSKFLTPKKENKFDSPPVVKIKKIKNAYKNIFTEFRASARDNETKKLKYTWDFGDGRKSYLAETRHKYLATGKYTVTLSVTDESQTTERKFQLNVKNSPRPDLEIVRILPNPAGKDTEGETVDIRNNSGKKVNLKNWKIASGSGSGKIYNHPIVEDFFAGPGETKTVTRQVSKFSLNNKSGKLHLVFPDGKIADKLEYTKEKIADDEAYVKQGDEWTWITKNKPNDGNEKQEGIAPSENDDTADTDDENVDEGEVLGATDAIAAPYKTGFSSEDAYIFLSRLNFLKPAREMNYTPMFGPSSGIAYLLSLLI